MTSAVTSLQVSLDDKYQLDTGVALMTGVQALVRLPLLQSRRDRKAGLRTAGFVSGYRGSPLGTYDRELWRARSLLSEHNIQFRPGLNEDLAATSVWGTQQVGLFPGDHDGVFALWYGKGPGIDRSGDVLRHGNFSGAAKTGGVLVVVGDDPAAKSSTIIQQSEFALAAACIPVLSPAGVGDVIDFGLAGWALSRYSGLWTGLKCVNETLETDITIRLDGEQPVFVAPEFEGLPPEGVNFRGVYGPTVDEMMVMRHRIPLAKRFAYANRLDRVAFGVTAPRLGLVASGKTYSDVMYALQLLGIDTDGARASQLDVYKVGMIWPLEERRLVEFADGIEELFVVEEKRAFIETQIASALYRSSRRPRLLGKLDADGRPLLPAYGTLNPLLIAVRIGERLKALGLADVRLLRVIQDLSERLSATVETQQGGRQAPAMLATGEVRTPYFCSGCPHNTSTRIPEGSVAFGGIGCHTMAMGMGRSTLPPTHMGGEGANWIGIAPFVKTPHVFQNLGDGTYFHSGLLALRAAVAAQVNITYKVLYNAVVAMTGGQPVDGALSVPDLVRQVLAEGVVRCVVVTAAPEGYSDRVGLPPGVMVHHRDEMEAVQRMLRDTAGVTVLVYDQVCAAEKRRQIKRKLLPAATRRVFINSAVCEGCGDCSTKSNCVSVLPLQTPLGRKRAIDQSSCNEDLSCVSGFCPSFAIVRDVRPRRRLAIVDATASPVTELPPPARAKLRNGRYNVMITGIGGTGVITIGAILAMAARLENTGASTYNMTGLAQKNGPVYSHLRFGAAMTGDEAVRIEAGEADLVLACDVLAALAAEAAQTIRRSLTRVVINSHVEPTAALQLFRDAPEPGAAQCARLAQLVGPDAVNSVAATEYARQILGDKIASNMIIVGYACQRGLLPVGVKAIERAIELNGAAVSLNLQALRIGRELALGRAVLEGGLGVSAVAIQGEPTDLAALLDIGRRLLTGYQNEAYATRFVERVRRIANLESSCLPGESSLAMAVARYYRRLLAYKDEYEVARLHSSPAFRAAIDAAFEGKPRVSLLLAPPILGGAAGSDGNPRKREFGAWVFPLLRVLASFKWLRGTALDPFGRTSERRGERAMIRHYEAWLNAIEQHLSAETHALAVRIASLPDAIRGFGDLKARAMTTALEAAAPLLAEMRGERHQVVRGGDAAAHGSGAQH